MKTYTIQYKRGSQKVTGVIQTNIPEIELHSYVLNFNVDIIKSGEPK